MPTNHFDRFVEKTDGAYRIRGTRVSLDSVVWGFLNGQTSDASVKSFASLSPEQVEGALGYYLAHHADIDAYLARGEVERAALRRQARDQDPLWYRKLGDARRAVA
jgi:uncharacterized protein (DUF433 family)